MCVPFLYRYPWPLLTPDSEKFVIQSNPQLTVTATSLQRSFFCRTVHIFTLVPTYKEVHVCSIFV